jgi:uncharacterized UBP type Zn finger protein
LTHFFSSYDFSISNPSSLCYRNAIFQSLSSLLNFREGLHSSASGPISLHLSRALEARHVGFQQELEEELEELRLAFAQGKNSFFHSIRQQQCAEEFLTALLDAMEQQESCRAVGLQFGGRLEERYSCSW